MQRVDWNSLSSALASTICSFLTLREHLLVFVRLSRFALDAGSKRISWPADYRLQQPLNCDDCLNDPRASVLLVYQLHKAHERYSFHCVSFGDCVPVCHFAVDYGKGLFSALREIALPYENGCDADEHTLGRCNCSRMTGGCDCLRCVDLGTILPSVERLVCRELFPSAVNLKALRTIEFNGTEPLTEMDLVILSQMHSVTRVTLQWSIWQVSPQSIEKLAPVIAAMPNIRSFDILGHPDNMLAPFNVNVRAVLAPLMTHVKLAMNGVFGASFAAFKNMRHLHLSGILDVAVMARHRFTQAEVEVMGGLEKLNVFGKWVIPVVFSGFFPCKNVRELHLDADARCSDDFPESAVGFCRAFPRLETLTVSHASAELSGTLSTRGYGKLVRKADDTRLGNAVCTLACIFKL